MLIRIYIILLVLFSIYILLDTFIIKDSYQVVRNDIFNNDVSTGKIEKDNNSYQDDNIKIEITTYRENDTNIYVASVELKDSSYLKTAFANSIYGKNITDKTSNIANSVSAILAINGDFYGVQEKGYVLRNGVIYRDVSSNNQEDLVIYKDGSWDIINESNVSLKELLDDGVYNLLSFGPVLIKDNNIAVSENDEVGRAMASNPRTAIGIISNNHYVFVVSDGRSSESKGLSLFELANFMKGLNCSIAYNLDGGGSSTMYFNGMVINNPTTNGKRISERSISDIVYVGY